ncbi:MAG: hypothetical protein ACRDY4_07700 [Acidimicrobiia bacterium]
MRPRRLQVSAVVLAGTLTIGAVACDGSGESTSPNLPDDVDVEQVT